MFCLMWCVGMKGCNCFFSIFSCRDCVLRCWWCVLDRFVIFGFGV